MTHVGRYYFLAIVICRAEASLCGRMTRGTVILAISGCCYWGGLGGGETSGRSGDKDDARAGPPSGSDRQLFAHGRADADETVIATRSQLSPFTQLSEDAMSERNVVVLPHRAGCRVLPRIRHRSWSEGSMHRRSAASG